MASYSGRKGRKAVPSDHHKFGSTDVRISSKVKRVAAVRPLTLSGEYDKPLAKGNGAKSEKLSSSSEMAVADKHAVKLIGKQSMSGPKQNLKRAGNEPNQKSSSGTKSTSSLSATIFKKMRHVLREEMQKNSGRSSDKSATAMDETNTDDSLLDSDSESAVPSTTVAKQNLPSNVRITASKAKTSKGKSKETSKAVSAGLKKSSPRNSDNEAGDVKLSKRLGLKRMKKSDFVAECLPSNSEAEDADIEDTDLQEVGNIGSASDDDCVFKKPKPPTAQLKASCSATVGVKDRKKAAVQPTSSLSAGNSSKGRKKVVVQPTITSSQSESASTSSSDEGRKRKNNTVQPTSVSQSESASSSDEDGRKKKTTKSARPVSLHSASSSSDRNRKTVRPVSSQSESASSGDEGKKNKKTKASVRLASSQSAGTGVSADCRKKAVRSTSSQSKSASSSDEGKETKKVAVQSTSSQSAGGKKKAVQKTSESESASSDSGTKKQKQATKSVQSSLTAGSSVDGRKNVVESTSKKVSSGTTGVDARSDVSRKKAISKHVSRSSSSAHEKGSSDCESTDTDKRSSSERTSRPPSRSRSLPGKENMLKRKTASGGKKVDVKIVSSGHDNTAAVSEPVSKQRRINGNTEQRVAPSRGSKSAVKGSTSHQDNRQSDTESDTSDNDLPQTKSKLQIAKERRWRKQELEKQQQKLKAETEEAQRAMMQKISAQEIDGYFKRLRSVLQQPINS